MKISDLWSLSYRLCGCTLLGLTPQEPLGPLPLPLRIAVLKIATCYFPNRVSCDFQKRIYLEYSGGEHTTYSHWRTQPHDLNGESHRNDQGMPDDNPYALLDYLKQLNVEQIPDFDSIDAFFNYYQLNSDVSEENDEHWAERQFIKRVFIAVCGLEGLRYLKPQVPFQVAGGVQRRIDFVLEGASRYAVEIEGKTYHAGEEKFDGEKARQRELATAGFTYFPVSMGDINTGKAKEALRAHIAKDVWLRPLLEPAGSTELLELAGLLVALPKLYPDAQRAALALIANACEQSQPKLTVAEIGGVIPILTLALIDTLGVIERVANFYGISVTLPSIDLFFISPRDRKLPEALLQQVLQSNLIDSERIDIANTTIHLTCSDKLPTHIPADAVIIANRLHSGLERLHNGSAVYELEETLQQGRDFVESLQHPMNPLPIASGSQRPTLDYFTRRYFQVPELKDEQLKLIKRILEGKDSLGILPTGFGKSLVFQLYALLNQRVTLVISPLKALIQDQIGALHRLGWTCVNSIISTHTAQERRQRLNDLFHEQRYRLFYIAPERLQVKTFYDDLYASLRDTPLGALVIDEAHCVSEWGHDFRPAYLQIPRLRQLLLKSSGRPVPLLALTATASELVRRDILETLEITEDCLLQTASADRRNLSLSVHRVSPEKTAKSKMLAHLLANDFPKLLRRPNEPDILKGKDGYFPKAGIVFAIYADPHGKTTFHEGTAQIAADLRKRLQLSKDQIRTHASRVPKVCPSCGSHNFWPSEQHSKPVHSGPASLKCQDCQKSFTQSQRVKSWDEYLAKSHEAFQRDQFPLLVATKGFGMGIDKRNISLVIHHGFSSGLEGYYQEAGRAGRANQRAHVALLYVEPHSACIEEALDQGQMPRCITEPDNYKYRRCPYKLQILCDFGHQARFIEESYPGIDSDCQAVYGVYRRLKANQALASHDGYNPDADSGGDGANDTSDLDRKQIVYQLALYRLQQLGIVRGYTIDYLINGWRFEVDFKSDWSPHTLLVGVKTFLNHKRRSDTGDDIAETMQILEALAAQCGSPPWPLQHRREEIALLKKAIGTLLRRVYSRVRAMRLQMLRNELDYVRAADGTCRRATLLNIFNNEPTPSDYRCGFCDGCVPNLQFKQELATNPIGNVGLEELTQRLGSLLNASDLELKEIKRFIQDAKEYQVIPGMLARVTRYLEGDPTALPALYLAGALSWQLAFRKSQALGYFHAGAKEAGRNGKATAALATLFYGAGAEIDLEEALRWLNGLSLPDHELIALIKQNTAFESSLDKVAPAVHALDILSKVRALDRLNIPLAQLKVLASEWKKPISRQRPKKTIPNKRSFQ